MFKLTLLCIFSYSQNQTIVIKAIDSKGQTDSVIIGNRSYATVGIDQSLAEENYFGKLYSEIDIRSIQRMDVLQAPYWLKSCNYNNVPPFTQNIDLKEDYRETLRCGNHFIIQVHAKNYPVSFQVSRFNFFQHIYFESYSSDGGCGSILDVSSNFSTEFSKIVFHNSTENQLIGLHPQDIDACFDGLKKVNSNTQLTLYLNPATDKISIDNLTELYTFDLLDLKGSVMLKTNVNASQNTVNLSQYDKGLYLYRISANGVLLKAGKIVKI